MASKIVSSGFWTPDQERLMYELSNSSGANMDPASSPSQTPPSKPKPLAPVYERILKKG